MPALIARRGPVLVVAGSVACLVVLGVGWHDGAQAGVQAGVRTGVQAAPARDWVAAGGSARQSGGAGDAGATPDVVAGRQLYVVRCSSCHGLDVRGTANGPELVDSGAASADFYLRTGRMPLNDPRQPPSRHRPAFPELQIRQLVAYIGSLDPGRPLPALAPGNLANGNQLFQLDCAQCHNVAGSGGSLGYGDIVPNLRQTSPLDAAEAMRIGPKPMPIFGPGTLSDQQVSDIATYVQYLHHPQDRGGLGLGHLGPIPEGFVGWVVGIGVLLVAARLIGTRG